MSGVEVRRCLRLHQDIAELKAKILASRLSISELVYIAWSSAATFRGSDKRGGADSARIRCDAKRARDDCAALLDMSAEWVPAAKDPNLFEDRDRKTSEVRWATTRVDLIIGHHGQLSVIAEVHASPDSEEKVVRHFVAAWNDAINVDRCDQKRRNRRVALR